MALTNERLLVFDGRAKEVEVEEFEQEEIDEEQSSVSIIPEKPKSDTNQSHHRDNQNQTPNDRSGTG